MSIKLQTETKAKTKYCPYNVGEKCIVNKCMGWIETYRGTSRENHSGGKEMMMDATRNHGVSIDDLEYSGRGCDQVITLAPIGYCGVNSIKKELLD